MDILIIIGGTFVGAICGNLVCVAVVLAWDKFDNWRTAKRYEDL